jgi:hypothetical protein
MSNGTVVVGQYKGRPVCLIQDHPFWHRDGHMVTKRRYEYADKYRENGKPEKEFVWPPGTRLSDLRLFGWEDLKRLQPGEPIFLVEGEKTCDALSKRGFVAVSMAASAMRDYSALDDLFAYPENPVIVCPDNDAAGLKAASGWFDHLKRSHPKVKWLPPVSEDPGGDFADLLSEFGRDADKEARAAVLYLVNESLDGPPQPTVAEVPTRDKKPELFPGPEDFNDLVDEPDEEMVSYGLFTEGTWIVAGAPKLGKSYFALSYAHGLSLGGAVLGQRLTDGEPCDVLAFILEDGRRRYKQRLKRRVEGFERPERGRFNIWFKWPRLDDESLSKMEELIAVRAAAGRKVVVVIDTGTKLRPLEDRNTSIYMGDYNFLDPLTEIAQRHHCLILVIAHTRKAPSVDFIDSVIGSHGISGAVDGIAVLSRERHSMQATLEWTGRDGQEERKFLTWDAISDGWLLTDEPDQATAIKRAMVAVIERIKERLATEGRAMGAKELRIALAIKQNTITDALDLAVQWRMLTTSGTGSRGDAVLYHLPDSVPGIDTEPGTE